MIDNKVNANDGINRAEWLIAAMTETRIKINFLKTLLYNEEYNLTVISDEISKRFDIKEVKKDEKP